MRDLEVAPIIYIYIYIYTYIRITYIYIYLYTYTLYTGPGGRGGTSFLSWTRVCYTRRPGPEAPRRRSCPTSPPVLRLR